jgi:hypothetical protein
LSCGVSQHNPSSRAGDDAGGPTRGWWQDHYGPRNSVRVFKGYLAAALLAPLLGAAMTRDRAAAMR